MQARIGAPATGAPNKSHTGCRADCGSWFAGLLLSSEGSAQRRITLRSRARRAVGARNAGVMQYARVPEATRLPSKCQLANVCRYLRDLSDMFVE